MKIGLIFLTLLVSYSCANEEDVLQLTDEDFNSKLSQHDTVLVMFYAPW